MSGSIYVDKAASQEMSVVLNQAMVSFNLDEVKVEDKQDEKIARSKESEKSEISRLLESKSAKEMTAEVLTPFFSKLARVGITIGNQVKNANLNNDELDKIAARVDSYEDCVELKNSPDIVQQIKKFNQHGGGNAFAGYSQDDVLALLKEYAAVLAEAGSSPSVEIAEKLKDLRQKLLEKGVSDAKLQNLEASLKKGQKVDLTEMVKESLILQFLSDSRIEKSINKRGLVDLLKQVDIRDAADIFNKARFKAAEEMRGFVLEELENVLIKKTHLQDADFRDAMKLLDLAEKSGINYSDWLENVWPKKKDDHGLYLLDVPHSATGMNVNTSTDNPNQNGAPKHGFEYEKTDENEILINRLRALYMQRALKGDAFTFLQTEFKVRKLKNGLFKLGIFTKDLDEKVQHEAEVVAKVKIIEMLKEALIERATFYDLAGPAHQLVEKKIKGLLKNAERLGMPISAQEFNLMRDNANLRVFDLSRRELEEVRMTRNVKDSKKLEKKEKFLVRLLTRLKEESKIDTSIASFS